MVTTPARVGRRWLALLLPVLGACGLSNPESGTYYCGPGGTCSPGDMCDTGQTPNVCVAATTGGTGSGSATTGLILGNASSGGASTNGGTSSGTTGPSSESSSDTSGGSSSGSTSAASSASGTSSGGTATSGGSSSASSSSASSSSGSTSDCQRGIACTPANVCHAGSTDCSSGQQTCTDTGANPGANGTRCGANQVCDNGSCVACTAGVACAAANACHVGVASCATGTSTCTDTGAPVGNGTSCGANAVCLNGSCASCTAGQPCAPANACHVGTTDCSSGRQACADTGAAAADGTSCGANSVCVGGNCTARSGPLTVTVAVAGGASPVTTAWVNIDGAHQGAVDGNGAIQWSNSPAPPFNVAVTAPYCDAVYQAVNSATTSVAISMTCGPATPNTDQIDMSLVTVYDSPPDTPGWPVTTYITTLDLDFTNNQGMYINFTKRDGNETWPNVDFGGSGGSLEYTLWSVEYIGGQWAASGPIEYWQGDEYSGGWLPGFVADWYYDGRWGPLDGYQPTVGELVGFFVSAGNARNIPDDSGTLVIERSNVVLVPFPDASGAVYFFDGPCGGLASGGSLGMGQSLRSCDGRFTLTMQTGGDLSLAWSNGAGQLWDDGQSGNPTANVYMQTDGNLVSYRDCGSNGGPIWNAGTSGNPGATLVLDDGGNLSVQLDGTILWQTNTGGN